MLGTNAFVILPTHMHAILFDREFNNERPQHTIADFRNFTGRSLCDFCDSHLPRCFSETLWARSREDRQRQFWQPSRRPEVLVTESFWQQKLRLFARKSRPHRS